MTFRRYRTRKLVEAKQVDHDFSMYDPRPNHKVEGRAGDYIVKEPGQPQRVEPKERFEKDYEPVD